MTFETTKKYYDYLNQLSPEERIFVHAGIKEPTGTGVSQLHDEDFNNNDKKESIGLVVDERKWHKVVIGPPGIGSKK